MKRKPLIRPDEYEEEVQAPRYTIPLGKPAKCNVAVRSQMAYYLKRMIPIKDACFLIGLFENTHYRWMRLGREYIELYEDDTNIREPNEARRIKRNRVNAEYYVEVNRSVGEMRERVISRSLEPDSNNPSWVRDMTILERRDRDTWARIREPLTTRDDSYDPDESFL